MDPLLVGLVGLIVFLILVAFGLWVGFAAALVGIIGITAIKGWGAMAGVISGFAYDTTASFSLSVIPFTIRVGIFTALNKAAAK